jgi:transposase InsO family protein
MCRVLKISSRGFYASRTRTPSAKQLRREHLTAKICEIHAASNNVFGSPKIYRELKKIGMHCNRKTVANCMKRAGICSNIMKKHRVCTTDSSHSLPVAENILNRDFTATKPGEKLVGDITYIATDEGWLYLAVVIDLFSRKVVGWSMNVTMQACLVIDALQMAVSRSEIQPGCIMHSDRGSQYASRAHRAMLEQHGMVCSMSRKGNCWDNAVAESFFASLKKEKIYHEEYSTHDEARSSIFHYLEVFYNRRRPHSAIDYKTPFEMHPHPQ